MTKPGRMFATFSLIQINSLLTVPHGLTGILPESTNPRDLTDGLPESAKRPGMLSLPVLPVYYVIFSFYAIRYFCAAIAAFAPSAAAVMICRNALVRISPAAKMPG